MAERKRSRHTAGADLTGRGAELPVGAEVGRCRHPVAAEGHTRRRKARAALGGSSQVEVAAGTGSGDTRNSLCFRLLQLVDGSVYQDTRRTLYRLGDSAVAISVPITYRLLRRCVSLRYDSPCNTKTAPRGGVTKKKKKKLA